MRRVWNLPYNCHTAIIENLSGNIPIIDFICNRNLNFIKNCLCSGNILVNFVVKHGVFLVICGLLLVEMCSFVVSDMDCVCLIY